MDWIKKIEEINPHFFDELKNTSHNYKDTYNRWHQEHDGNVYGHIEDVYNVSKELYPDDYILHLAALLHDVAKPLARFEEDNKTKFYSHESLGPFLAIDILKALNIGYYNIIRVLELIQRHADPYKYSKKNILKLYTEKAFKDVLKIRRCDMIGRISDYESHQKDLDNYIEITKIKFPEENLRETKIEKPICTFLVGPPCSGKSTYASKITSKDNILSRDDIIMELGTSNNYTENWNSIDQDEVQGIFEDRLKKFIHDKKDFIIDMTLMSVKSRRKYIERLKKYFNLNAEVFIVEYEELLERNAFRKNKKLNPDIIINMCKRFQMIYPKEGFSSINYHF